MDRFEQYVHQAHTAPVLSRDDEAKLVAKAQSGDKRACNTLMASNLRYVVQLAYMHKGYGLLIEDLVGEGSIGLLEALKKFDLSRNMRFITYAAHWIRARMGEFVRIKKDGFTGGMGTGKVRYQAFYGFNAKREKLEMQGVPSEKIMGILAKEFGTTEERLTASVQRHAVYSMPYEDAGIPMFDKHPNAEELLGDFEHAVVVKSKVTKSLRKLDARQRKVVHDRIMNDETVTLDTLGSIFQVSRERVRQIEVKALDKLRNLLAEHAA